MLVLENRQQTKDIRPRVGSIKKSSDYLAERHENWCKVLPAGLESDASRVPAVLAVGGGKGGVGKSIFSANLAAKFAQLGLKVIVADMDIGCSNLHTHFGIHRPQRTFADLIGPGSQNFESILLPTDVPNLHLITGGREQSWIETYEQDSNTFLMPLWRGLIDAHDRNQVDVIIFDLGAGLHDLTVEIFASAHMGISVTLPEPTSIENAYVFLKSVLLRLAEKAALSSGCHEDLTELLAKFQAVGRETKGTYVDAIKSFAQVSPELVTELIKLLRSRSMGLIVNQARSQYEMDLSLSMKQICGRYFGFHAVQLGYLSFDDAAWKSLRNRRLLLRDFPHGPFASNINHVASEILYQLGYKER